MIQDNLTCRTRGWDYLDFLTGLQNVVSLLVAGLLLRMTISLSSYLSFHDSSVLSLEFSR
jgi:hypothetical protein